MLSVVNGRFVIEPEQDSDSDNMQMIIMSATPFLIMREFIDHTDIYQQIMQLYALLVRISYDKFGEIIESISNNHVKDFPSRPPSGICDYSCLIPAITSVISCNEFSLDNACTWIDYSGLILQWNSHDGKYEINLCKYRMCNPSGDDREVICQIKLVCVDDHVVSLTISSCEWCECNCDEDPCVFTRVCG